ncbi:MAG TPA: AbrB/MazE/SpoVT family DNA-binding domain-containing protein [Virgibacillus sp.]|nr:AbrB/MazE/SpoVT family DNA-binding domain-containing protein [Virgibacillus sp.]HLR67231.1 AbrB/MazE/SpoVT family DNA-binding domain-containing protein [Virgibacillus sp.]
MNINKQKRVLNMTATVQKWGNSLGVRIPQKIAKQFDVVNGSKLEVIATDQGIMLKPVDNDSTLEELLAKVTPENKHDEINFGGPTGRELF